MAVAYTASILSGNLTNVIYYDNGPQKVMQGHFSAPSSTSGLIETGMFGVTYFFIADADQSSYTYSAGANGTIAAYFSGHAAGATGAFEIRGF